MFCTKWGTILSDHGVFCEKCGYALAVPPGADVDVVRSSAKRTADAHGSVSAGVDAAPPASVAAFTATTSAKGEQPISRGRTAAVASTGSGRRSQLSVGTVVFVSLSLLSLVAFLVGGAAGSFAAESVVWAALAWYCYEKSPVSRAGAVLLLLIAPAVAAGEGFPCAALARQPLYVRAGKGTSGQGGQPFGSHRRVARSKRLGTRQLHPPF